MKLSILFLSVGFLYTGILQAQNQLSKNTHVEIGVGYIQPNF